MGDCPSRNPPLCLLIMFVYCYWRNKIFSLPPEQGAWTTEETVRFRRSGPQVQRIKGTRPWRRVSLSECFCASYRFVLALCKCQATVSDLISLPERFNERSSFAGSVCQIAQKMTSTMVMSSIVCPQIDETTNDMIIISSSSAMNSTNHAGKTSTSPRLSRPSVAQPKTFQAILRSRPTNEVLTFSATLASCHSPG